MGCCAAGAPASGLPGLVVRANDSGLEGAWVLIQAERAFQREGVCVREATGSSLNLPAIQLPNHELPRKGKWHVSHLLLPPKKKRPAFIYSYQTCLHDRGTSQLHRRSQTF